MYVAARDRRGRRAGVAQQLRELTERLGGTHHRVTGDDPAQAVLDLARGIDATQVVVGVSRRGPVRSALRAGVGPASSRTPVTSTC